MTPKLPREPPVDLSGRTPDWHIWTEATPMWHIAGTAGPYATRFGQMRAYGPLASARFDPHPEPPSIHPIERVLYTAVDLVTALAERFQANRAIYCADPSRPVAYAWSPTRELRLIDLTGLTPLRWGASQLLSTGPKRVTRTWARAVREAWPAADGLLYPSSLAGRACAALWAPAADSLPEHPAFAKLLTDPTYPWATALAFAAIEIHYELYS